MRPYLLPRSFMCILSCLAGLVVSSHDVVAMPVIESSGSITADWEAGAISLDSTLTAGWVSETMQAQASMQLSETGIDRFSTTLVVSLRDGPDLNTTAAFDPQSATFTQATFGLEASLLDADVSLSGVLEPGAFGSNLSLTATGNSVVRSLSIGFNLNEYGTIQASSCAPPFTFAEARFAIPVEGCDATATADIRWDAAGFSELSISAPHVGGLPFGVSFGAFLTFTTQEKSLEISPSFNLENPNCFDFYTGLVWDAQTSTISGIQFYGMGMRWEIGDVRFRMLYCLEPSSLALVKSPYKSLIGLVWPIEGCCGLFGEGSLAFFFGEDNLFDVGEIDGELVLPLSNALTLSFTVAYPMIGLPTFQFGWNYRI